jgi:hypothetical protein
MPPIGQLVHNQYLLRLPTFKLEELVPIMRGVHVQQTTTIVLPINVHVTTRLPIYGSGV